MSNLEKYTQLKKLLDRYSKYTFSLNSYHKDRISITEKRGRCDSSSRNLDDEFVEWINAGLSRTEHTYSDISYNGGYAFGKALRDVALREMKIKLREYAENAKEEAKECLKTLGS